RAEGLPLPLSNRLRGNTYSELCRDARQALKDFGFTPPQPRTPTGQYASFTDELRAASGRPVQPAAQPPQGHLGVGIGASALPRQPQVPDMSSLIRGAAAGRRSVAHMYAEQIAGEGGE